MNSKIYTFKRGKQEKKNVKSNETKKNKTEQKKDIATNDLSHISPYITQQRTDHDTTGRAVEQKTAHSKTEKLKGKIIDGIKSIYTTSGCEKAKNI